MDIYRVAFIGHREICGNCHLADAVEQVIRQQLQCREYVEFYAGRSGDFDLLAASAVKRAQNALGRHNSSLILVQPYPTKDDEYYASYYDEIVYPVDPKMHPKSAITRRNRWMMEQADLLLAFVNTEQLGGARTALRYAEKKGVPVINFI